MFLGACGSAAPKVSVGEPDAKTQVTARVAVASSDVDAAVPDGTQVAGSRSGIGLYSWTRTANDVTLSFSDGTQTQKWTSAAPDGPNGEGAASSIAVGTNGGIWVAVGGGLMRFDTADGSETTAPLPEVRDNATAEALLPPEIRGTHFVRSVAVDDSGHVGIALRATNQIIRYDDATKKFGLVDLPSGAEPWSVGFYSDGTMAAGVADDQHAVNTVVLFNKADSIRATIKVADASRLLPYKDGNQLLVGTLGPSLVSEDGTVTAIPLPKGITPDQVAGALRPLPSGDIIVAAIDSFKEIDAAGRLIASDSYPSIACATDFANSLPQTDQNETTSTLPEGQVCPLAPGAFQTDAAGSIWIANPSYSPGPGEQRKPPSISRLSGLPDN